MSSRRTSGRQLDGRQIRVLHHTFSSPVYSEFPLSTQYVKTLVTVTTSKTSEFTDELSVREGELLELDSEPMSNELKGVVMKNGSIPPDWLVCVTPRGEKRLIRRHLVTKVEDTQARMYQLKKAADTLLNSLYTKLDKTTEIGWQIHELIGTNPALMKFFADQLIEAMKNSTCHKMKAMAAHALNHYMMENKDFVAYLQTKSEEFVKFARDAFSDQGCPSDVVDFISTLLSNWCHYFESRKGELYKLLDQITADKMFKTSVLTIVNKSDMTEEDRYKLMDSVQRVAKKYFSYFDKQEKIHWLVSMLVIKLKEANRIHRLDVMMNVYYLASLLFEVSEPFKVAFINDTDVENIYSAYGKEFDRTRYFEQWFPPPEPLVSTRVAPPPPEPILVHVQPVQRAPPLPPKPRTTKNTVYENFEKPSPSKPTPQPRTIFGLKHRNKPVDPKHRISEASQEVLTIMEPFLLKYRESELVEEEYICRSGYGHISLVRVGNVGVRLVAKKLHGSSLTENALKEEANLLKCAFHPHIVSIQGKIVSDETPEQVIGILTEYLEGGSLYQVIHNSQDNYDQRQVLIWMEHAASAISFLHSKNLVHRDIKPANMLLTSYRPPRDLKLCDFGMLKALKVNGMTGQPSRLVGTPGYVAPEIGIHGDSYSASVDVYSLGISIWEMVQRKDPYNAANQDYLGSPVKEKEQRRPSLRNPRYPWLSTLVERMWQRDPADRPEIEEVHEEIRSLQRTLGETDL